MRNLLIIGNGFDIDLGLKTKYSDFIESNCFDENKNNLFKSIYRSYKNMNWIDLENELKKYVTGVDRQNIKDEFNDLRNSLCDYLTQIEYNKINHESTAFKLFKIIANDVNNPYKIYTYNYTDLIEITQLSSTNISSLKCKNLIEYVHGKISDKSIILGFEDKANILSKYFFMIKSFSPYYNSHNIQYDLEEAKNIIFFGHSLGNTDYHYFEKFFQEQSNASLTRNGMKNITIFTYNDVARISILAQLREMNDKRTDLLYNLNKLEILCTGEERDQTRINDFLESLKMDQEKYKAGLEYLSSL